MAVGSHKNGYPLFSKDGRYIFLTLDSVSFGASILPLRTAASVTVWDPSQEFLPTQEAKAGTASLPMLAAVFSGQPGPVVILTQPGDRRISLSPSPIVDQVLVCNYKGNANEDYWRLAARENYSLVSLRNGTRKPVVGGLLYDNCRPTFSPGGNYIVWFDRLRQVYCSYSLVSGQIVDFSKTVPSVLGAIPNGKSNPFFSEGIVAWEVSDSSVLLNDGFDIWAADPKGIRPATNITSFFGRQNNIRFQYLEPFTNQGSSSTIRPGQKLLLRGFDSLSKDVGYYSLVLGSLSGPVKLMVGPLVDRGAPRRAKSADAYLVTLEGPQKYPNLYFTRDFVKFKSLSDLHPQASVNWYKVGLIHWKMPDSSSAVGVLYKPADFDSTKRYPLVFSLYEGMSDEVNTFQAAGASTGDINIPWFVNHGYLVCSPDINYQAGSPGESAYQTVLSCARFLSSFPWVDSTKMGLHGHSFGGYEVNYIITRTRYFAAACSAAGISDMTSLTYNLRYGVGESAEFVSEQGQMRMRGPVWNYRDEYVNGSPLYFADQVTTPLLLVHGDQDEKVPWAQAIGWFLALRRQGKSVWMVQYKGEGHTLTKDDDIMDYTSRLLQFYDYYLKGSQPPTWLWSENGNCR
jgi:dienelactone hydrolase